MAKRKSAVLLKVVISIVAVVAIATLGFLYIRNVSEIVYAGTQSCDGCKDIKETLTLYGNNTLAHDNLIEYTGGSTKDFASKGTWSQSNVNNSKMYTVTYYDSQNHKVTNYYQVENNKFVFLDNSGAPLNPLLDLTRTSSKFWFGF